jgi:hypothetical protein
MTESLRRLLQIGRRISDRRNPRSAKENSIVVGAFMDIPNGNGRWLSWRYRIRRCRNCRLLQEALEAGGREHEEIVVLGVARITQLVGDVARGDESIAFRKNEDLVPDDASSSPERT